MNINLHIERLVVDGLPLEQRQGPLLRAAVQQELTHLLADGHLVAQLGAGGASAFVNGGSMPLTERPSPGRLGEQIAAAVYGGLGGEE